MSCDDVRAEILNRDWDRGRLDAAAAVLAHLSECATCRAAIGQYDEVRRLLRIPDSAGITELHYGATEALGSGRVPPANGKAGKNIGNPAAASASRFQNSHWAQVAGLAAAFLIGLAGWGMYLHDRAQRIEPFASSPAPARNMSSRIDDAPGPDDSIRLTADDVDRGVQVFRTVSETFDGRASWVAIAGHSADMGLMPAPIVKRTVMLLRMVMLRNGEKVSSTDLVVVPGQQAKLDMPFEANQVLHYSIATTADRDRRFMVWAEVRTPGAAPETLAALATTMRPAPGQVLGAGRMVTSNGSYNLEVSFSEKTLPEVRP